MSKDDMIVLLEEVSNQENFCYTCKSQSWHWLHTIMNEKILSNKKLLLIHRHSQDVPPITKINSVKT